MAGMPGGPSIVPPPIFARDAGATPLSPLGGAVAPSAAAGPSDFTRMISKAPAPVVPEAPAPAPAAPAGTPAAAKRAIPMGLILVINAVLLVAVLLIVFVLRRPAPTVPTPPPVPTAPALPAPASPAP